MVKFGVTFSMNAIIRNVSSKKCQTIYRKSAELVTILPPFDLCHRKSSQVNLRSRLIKALYIILSTALVELTAVVLHLFHSLLKSRKNVALSIYNWLFVFCSENNNKVHKVRVKSRERMY